MYEQFLVVFLIAVFYVGWALHRLAAAAENGKFQSAHSSNHIKQAYFSGCIIEERREDT